MLIYVNEDIQTARLNNLATLQNKDFLLELVDVHGCIEGYTQKRCSEMDKVSKHTLPKNIYLNHKKTLSRYLTNFKYHNLSGFYSCLCILDLLQS